MVYSLLQQGHRRIGWIADASEEKMRWNKANDVFLNIQYLGREEGFIDEPEYLLVEARNRQEGRNVAFQLLSRTDRPTAIFTTSPLLAIEVLEVAQALDIKVPDALAIIDLNQSEIAEWLELSTIQMPLYEMGEWGVRQLVDNLEKATQSVALFTCEMSFVERGTTKHLAKSCEVSHYKDERPASIQQM